MRFSLLILFSFATLYLTGQSKQYDKLSIQELLDSAERRHEVSDYTMVNELLKKVRSRLDSNSEPRTLYYYHKLLGSNLFEMRNIPGAQKEFHAALKISEKLNDSLNIALVNSELANTLTLQGAYRDALSYYEKALLYFPEKDSQYTNTLMNMSLTYKGLNQYDKALSVLFKGQPYYEGIGDYRSLGTLENNIGEIYRDNIKDLDQANVHYRKAIVANKKANSERGLAQNYHNLANMFLELEKTDSALHYAKLSMRIKEKMGDEGGMASANYILADVYFQQGNHSQAISNFKKSLSLSKKYGLMEGVYYNNIRLGEIYRQQGSLSQGESYLLEAKQIAEGSEDLQIIGESYRLLFQFYKDQGDFENALTYNEKLRIINDSLSELRATQNLDELRTQYESELAKSENQVLREKDKAQNAHIANQKKLIYLAVASIVALLLLAIWLINMLRQRNRALISEQEGKTELEVQHQKLKASELQLQKTTELQNKILSVLGHDLRNPLNNISTLLGTVSDSQLDQDDFTQILGYLKKETDVSQIILQEILAWARLQMDEDGKMLETVKADELLSDIIDIHNHSAREKQIGINIKGAEVEFCADKNQMRSVFSNLLFNAIKYSRKGGQICVDIEEADQQVIFKIIDNGKGINPDVLDNLNKRHRVISEKGTSGERGTGIGLRIVNDFVEAHGGTLQFKNNEDAGATVTVIIPLHQKGSNQTLQLQNQ